MESALGFLPAPGSQGGGAGPLHLLRLEQLWGYFIVYRGLDVQTPRGSFKGF